MGVEPTRCCHLGILSPVRLPFRHTSICDCACTKNNYSDLTRSLTMEVPPGFEPGNKSFADFCLTAWRWYQIWQTSQMPNEFIWSGRRDSNPRHLPWQGNALPLSHSRRCDRLANTIYAPAKVCSINISNLIIKIKCFAKVFKNYLNFLN